MSRSAGDEMNHRVTIGLVGASHPHSRQHLRTLQVLDLVAGIIVADPDQEAGAALRQMHPEKIESVETELDELLMRDDVTALLIAVRNDQMPEMIMHAVTAGKHVMAEKPGGL